MTEIHSTSGACADAPIIIVAGPTASGKSACAVALARAFDGVVINADSMQIYDGLSVVTARPSAEEEAQAPHRLYGVLDAAESCSAGRWLDLAASEISAARAGGRLPILCGGTGLYLKALVQGIAPIPDIPNDVREAARARHAAIGGAAFREDLAVLDPEAAEKLPPGDSQRLIRAYEIVKATGRTQADWAGEPHQKAVTGRFATVAFVPDRAVLYSAIDARFEAMMAGGALDEVRTLRARGLDRALPALKAVGVRELLACLDGEMTLQEAVAKAQQSSRKYAKRQITWLRTQLETEGEAVLYLSAQYSESLNGKIFAFIRQFLLT